MCDYSLEAHHSRPAVKDEIVKSTGFPGTTSRGFCPAGDPGTAVCLLPGTELVFDKPIAWQGFWPMVLQVFKQSHSNLAIFRKVNEGYSATHHDALELEDGTVVLLTRLREGQTARILQLPHAIVPDGGVQLVPEAAREPASEPLPA